jgi:hypothetical protein
VQCFKQKNDINLTGGGALLINIPNPPSSTSYSTPAAVTIVGRFQQLFVSFPRASLMLTYGAPILKPMHTQEGSNRKE